MGFNLVDGDLSYHPDHKYYASLCKKIEYGTSPLMVGFIHDVRDFVSKNDTKKMNGMITKSHKSYGKIMFTFAKSLFLAKLLTSKDGDITYILQYDNTITNTNINFNKKSLVLLSGHGNNLRHKIVTAFKYAMKMLDDLYSIFYIWSVIEHTLVYHRVGNMSGALGLYDKKRDIGIVVEASYMGLYIEYRYYSKHLSYVKQFSQDMVNSY